MMMKKTNIWSLMALCFGLCGALTLTTACGDDDDETPGGSGQPSTSLTGTWKSVHAGEDGTSYTDAITLNNDGTFEERVTQVSKNWDHTPHSLRTTETIYKGTYSAEDGAYQVVVTEFWKWNYDLDQLMKDDDFPGEKCRLVFEQYGNGYVALSPLSGGVQFFTKDGEARQLPSLASHELLGRWEYRSRETGTTAMEMVDFYEFKADGTVDYGTYMYNFVDGFDAQGSKSTGIYVPISAAVGRSFFGGDDEPNIPSGAKLFSVVDDAQYTIGQREPGNFNTNYWEFVSVRFGGHPLQYLLRDGKLYAGIIGMDEEYFYGRPYTKVQ